MLYGESLACAAEPLAHLSDGVVAHQGLWLAPLGELDIESSATNLMEDWNYTIPPHGV
jgi:hypothetical protein